MIYDTAHGSGPLYTERCLVITLFKASSRIGKKEYAVSLYKIIKIHRTILSRLPVRHHYHLDSVMVETSYDKPTGRKEKPAAEGFRLAGNFRRKCVYGF